MIGGMKKQTRNHNEVLTLMQMGHKQTQGLLVNVPKRFY